MNGAVSICIPVYNGSRYLEETLHSLLHNLDKCVTEILIVDDNSTDDSVAICEKFALNFPVIRLVQNQKNLGLVGNWNECLRLAKGEWVQFLFQDDLMLAGAASIMLEKAKEHNVRLVLCDRNYLLEEGADPVHERIKRITSYTDDRVIHPEEILKILSKDFLDSNFLGEPISGIIHRSLVDAYGNFDGRLKQVVDFEFWLRICLNEPFFFVDQKLVVFRLHPDSQSAKNRKLHLLDGFVRDRIVLGEKLFTHPAYSSVQDHAGKVAERYYSFIRLYTRKFGIRRMKKATKDFPFTHELLNRIIKNEPVLYLITLRRELTSLIKS